MNGSTLMNVIKTLLAAAESGDVAGVVSRLDAGDDIECRAKGTGRTPLLEAVIAGRVDVVEELCRRGADVNAACTAVGDNALMWASGSMSSGVDEATSLALVNILLAHGADPTYPGKLTMVRCRVLHPNRCCVA